MDIKTLMIGDWVYNKHHGKNIRLTPYDFFTHTHNEFGEQGLAPYAKPTFGSDLEPIPLTPEILEKNGFSHNEIWHNSFIDIEICHIDIQFGYGGKVDNIRIRENRKGSVIPSEQNNIYLAHIEYVHQLQHAMRICGIEKEIII